MKKAISLIVFTPFILILSACNTTQTPESSLDQASTLTQDSEVESPVEKIQETQANLVKVPEVKNTPVPTSEEESVNNWFDLAQAHVGQKVVEMTLVELNLNQNENLLPSGSVATFEGKVEVTGNYEYYDDHESIMGGNVCFSNLTEESIAKIPRAIGDLRDVWFCFTNSEKAQNEFGPQGSTGVATVVIDNYFINTFESEVWNTATLVKVISR